MKVRTLTTLVVVSSALVVGSCGDDGPAEPVIPVTVETPELEAAIEGRPYAATLEAAGGSGTYVWDVASGSLPTGLVLSADGTIEGTPTAPGTAGFRVRATDGRGRTGTADLSIAVTPALVVRTATLADAIVGLEYNERLIAEGGRPDHVWRLVAGDAPWLSVLPDGAMRGAPSAIGFHAILVAVTDASGQEATRELWIDVVDPVAIRTETLPEALQGRAYGVRLEAAGGDATYRWRVKDGALPPGLELLEAGAITGVPGEAGTFAFTLEVVDGKGRWATRSLTLPVEPAPVILTASLAPATPGTAYSATLEATGGTGAYAWSVEDGTVPAGLALSPDGIISGTPSAVGTSTFTVRVADERGRTDDQELVLTVVSAIETLSSGVARTGLTGDAGSDRYFVIDVPTGSARLRVSISGGSGDADLYLRRGTLPGDFTYDCRPLRAGNEETCEVTAPAGGSWYVRLRAHETYDGVTLMATVQD